MENKKSSLATVLLLIAVIVIIIMAALIYIQKTESDKQMADLEAQKVEMQNQIDNLQGKIDSVSNILNNSTLNNKSDIKIEGEYNSIGTEPHGCTYEFLENKVIYTNFETIKGEFEIVDNKIKISYTEAYSPEGTATDFYPNGQKEELIIVDENTLMSKKEIDGKVYVGTYVKE